MKKTNTKFTCRSCDHEFNGILHHDDLGWHTACPKCGASLDIDVPMGRIVMAFADDSNPEEDAENFTDSFPGKSIRTYYTFNTVDDFRTTWERMVIEPDGMWYFVLDDNTLLVSGACDEVDAETFEQHFGTEW